MHNEFVGTRAPRAAAFCCFKAAEVGGEFLVGDGRRVFRDLDISLLEELYRRQIRYSVMELPFFGWMDPLPKLVQEPLMQAVKALVSTAINAKVDFEVEMLWGESGYDNTRMLQARAPRQPPIVIHPTTGDPTWFCNVHSHSSKLRHEREKMYEQKFRYHFLQLHIYLTRRPKICLYLCFASITSGFLVMALNALKMAHRASISLTCSSAMMGS